MQTEILEGDGQLEKWDGPHAEHPVRYRFEITREAPETSPSRVALRLDGRGSVVSTSGEQFGEGEYRLYAEPEIFKVKNLGQGLWVILSAS